MGPRKSRTTYRPPHLTRRGGGAEYARPNFHFFLLNAQSVAYHVQHALSTSIYLHTHTSRMRTYTYGHNAHTRAPAIMAHPHIPSCAWLDAGPCTQGQHTRTPYPALWIGQGGRATYCMISTRIRGARENQLERVGGRWHEKKIISAAP